MGQISMDTLERIYRAKRDIDAANSLIKLIDEHVAERKRDTSSRWIKDAFGRERQMELGVPMESGSLRCYSVAPELASVVLRAHVARQEALLAEANECARVELMDAG